MSSKVQRADPAYMQVAKDIRRRIQSGELKPGEMVPSAREITKEWDVSLATATKVLATLQSEGLAHAKPGIGTEVIGVYEDSPRERLSLSRATDHFYPDGQYAKIKSAELVEAPERVAVALGVAPGSQVIRRGRITYSGDEPVEASVSWFRGDLAAQAPKLLELDRIEKGTPRYVAEQTGLQITYGHDVVGARLATAEDAADLGVAVGSALSERSSWFYDSDQNVIEYGEYSAPGARGWSEEYRIER